MALAKSEVETLLINGKDLTDDDQATLTTNLRKMTLKQLKLLAKNSRGPTSLNRVRDFEILGFHRI